MEIAQSEAQFMCLVPDYFPEKTKSALVALKDFMATSPEYAREHTLWSDKKKIYLNVGFNEPLNYRSKPALIPLENPIKVNDVCILVKRRRKEVMDVFNNLEHWTAPFVLSIGRLRTKYKDLEQRRILMKKYDLFLCDEKIYKHMNRLLGNKFELYKKFPIPICLTGNNIGKRYKKIVDSTYLFYRGGPSCSVCVGTSDMDETSIYRNIVNVVEYVVKTFHGGMGDIYTMGIKSQNSPNLPIYKSGATIISDDSPINI